MRFAAKTQKEIDESKLIPEGEYSFEVSSAADKISKSGNEMIEVWLRVYKPDGSFIQIADYLLESIPHKLLHICETLGLSAKYQSGQLTGNDFQPGMAGKLKLGIQKDKTGNYPDRNAVKDYIVDGKAEIPKDGLSKMLDKKDDMEDSIPF